MDIRQKFFDAMRRKSEGFVPFSFSLCPSQLEEFARRTGHTDYAAYYGFPTRTLGVPCLADARRFRARWYAGDPDVMISPDFGFGSRKGTMAHFTSMVFPLEGLTDPTQIAEYPWPDPTRDMDWETLEQRARQVKEQGLVAMAGMEITLFESAWYLRGMERFLEDIVVFPEMCEALLERLCVIREEMARRYALAGLDVLCLGDDVGTQIDMMMAPRKWEAMLKPRLARVIAAAKAVNPDILITYHSDGNIARVVPGLIEAGVEVLNPIQPECMDAIELKRLYGDRLSFWGGVGTQSTMPFGTPKDVRGACLELIAKVGEGGGLYLAPTHVLEPEVPYENIEAFVLTVTEYNGAQ